MKAKQAFLGVVMFGLVAVFAVAVESGVDERLLIALGLKTQGAKDAAWLIDESATSIQGTIQVIHGDDLEAKVFTPVAYIKSESGFSLPVDVPLYFTENDFRSIDGKNASLNIVSSNGPKRAVLDQDTADKIAKEILPTSSSRQGGIDPVSLPNIRTAVIGFTFNDTPGIYPMYFDPNSTTGAKEAVFTDTHSTKAYFQEISGGKVNLVGSLDPTGDVFGPYTISKDLTCWPKYGESDLAKIAAAADGFVDINYDLIIFIYPVGNGCPSGFADWSTKSAYTGGWFENINHEVGHILGRMHANAYVCVGPSGSKVTMSDKCLNYEYGDPFDVMGHNGAHHFNVVGKIFQKYFDKSTIKTVTSTGTYTLDDTNRVLAIPRDFSTYYLLDYRAPFGQYDNWSPTDPVANGVTLRYYDSGLQNFSVMPFDQVAINFSSALQNWGQMDYHSHLLDATPGSITAGDDYIDAPIAVGASYTDLPRGISISTNSVSQVNKTATVHISIFCQQAPITFTLEQIRPEFIIATLKNNDSLGCSTKHKVNLSQGKLPFGWKWDPAYEVINPPVQSYISGMQFNLSPQESHRIFFVPSIDSASMGSSFAGVQDISLSATDVTKGNVVTIKKPYQFLQSGCIPKPFSVGVSPNTPITGVSGSTATVDASLTMYADPDCTVPISYTNSTFTVDVDNPGGHVEKGPELFLYPNISQTATNTFTLPGPHPQTGNIQFYMNFTCPTYFVTVGGAPYQGYGCIKHNVIPINLIPKPTVVNPPQD